MPDLPSGTVTFLFTDIQGGTERWEQDRAAMACAVATGWSTQPAGAPGTPTDRGTSTSSTARTCRRVMSRKLAASAMTA